MEHRENPNLYIKATVSLGHKPHPISTHFPRTLPIDEMSVRNNPRLQHSFEFPVTFRRGEQGVVLVTARDINVDLTVGGSQ